VIATQEVVVAPVNDAFDSVAFSKVVPEHETVGGIVEESTEHAMSWAPWNTEPVRLA
jgi:hypothetical protein